MTLSVFEPLRMHSVRLPSISVQNWLRLGALLVLLGLSMGLLGQTTYYSSRTDSTELLGGGAWTNTNSWTQDPAGAIFIGINIPTRGPGIFLGETESAAEGFRNDRVVILGGTTVILDANNLRLDNLGQIEVRADGRLLLRTNSGHLITLLDGEGTIALEATGAGTFTLPTVTTNNFILATGGTYEFGGNTNNGDIPNPVAGTAADYNNVRITGSRLHTLASSASNYVLNGNLTIDSTAGLRITNTAAKTVTVNGNVTVTSTRSALNDGAFIVEQGGTDNLDHTLNVVGNFTTSGKILFTNEGVTGNAARTRRVQLRFTNTLADQTFQTTGATTEVRLYDIGIAKGTDDTYILDVLNTNASPNWALLGPNSAGHSGTDTGTQDNLGTTLVELAGGTARFGSSCNFQLKSTGGGNYNIPEGSALWISGANVTATGAEAIVVYGRFQIDGVRPTQGGHQAVHICGHAGIVEMEGADDVDHGVGAACAPAIAPGIGHPLGCRLQGVQAGCVQR
ncbi:MAG: hypothetical protein SFY70_00155, partial [Bacteroidia bacterium]|nr:hypothetical protein [Bacteroidia bacterium]